MENVLIYTIILIGCFVLMAIFKICNTIFNIKKMKYIVEEKRIIADKLNDKGLDKLLDKIEIEVKRNENNK